MDKRIRPIKKFNKLVSVPADKSITHRAALFGAAACGRTEIINPLLSEDCLSTLSCVKVLGAKIEIVSGRIIIQEGLGGRDFNGAELYAGNSGTTARLIMGILAAQRGKSFVLSGDNSLSLRPMARVEAPLKLMGADIELSGGRLPAKINGRLLNGIDYRLPVASAQVKSAVILAGLYADGETRIDEPVLSRDHTERMLKAFGAGLSKTGNIITVKKSVLKGTALEVPGDISSAAFPIVLAAAKNGGKAVIKRVGVNPTRTGILQVLESCGASFRLFNEKNIAGEPVADIEIEYARLKPFNITKELVPSLVDEIPALAVLACFIEGKSVITGAEELKVKESNRIDTVVAALKNMGADISALADGMVIEGKGFLKGGAEIETGKDHRIAMSMAVAAALSENGAVIKDADCADISYPDFYALLE